jgi:competence protein ComEC
VLLAALALVLLIDPWAVLSAGFWFSFLAVACLLWLSAFRVGRISWWRTALTAQFAVFVALAPVGLALFQQVSLVGVLVNAIAIPLVSFVVVPLTLLWLLIPWDALLALAHAAFASLAWLCERVVNLPLAIWQQHAPPVWTVVLAMIGAFALIGPRALPGRALALMLLVPLFAVKPARPPHGTFTVTALDVGQGLAVVVQTATYDLLYDAGPLWGEDSDAGQRIVVPYLRAIGARLGAMVVSHQDADHSGGAAAVMKERVPDWVRSSFAEKSNERCVTGQQWDWDGVRFTFVHPTADDYEGKAKPNDMSCVLRVDGADGASALLTGDIEALAERALVARGANVRAALLTVPHHGSATSSTSEFVAAVAPQRAVVNAGYRNRFGHPRANVLDTYLQRNVEVDRTDWHGAVRYTWRDGRWDAQRWRDAERKYCWHVVATS